MPDENDPAAADPLTADAADALPSEQASVDGLPAADPDAMEEKFADEIDNIVPTYGYHQMPIVALGGSAGGIQALKAYFQAQRPDAGVAYVVIIHLSPEHESTLPSLLQTITPMPVKAAEQGEKLEKDHVYVIPPGKHLTVVNGHLKLSPLEPERGKRVAVDMFFRSLADTHGPHATAIVLSGADGDGAIGLKRIKERGGLTITQDPEEAEHPSMPKSSIDTGMVDWVLRVGDMPERIDQYRQSETQLRLPTEDGPQPALPSTPPKDEDEQALRETLVFLRTRTSRDFTYYKRATIVRRISRRMQINAITTLPGYLTFLRTHPGEAGALLQDLLISVTNFFRDREAFAAVEKEIPKLFADKGPGDVVRVWTAACATGEETYSFAMLLVEHARTLEHPPTIQVFGCDLDEQAIQEARLGVYPPSITADVGEDRLTRFFTKEARGYRVRRELREMVLFAEHDLLKDAPFSRMDLISCRNLLIYLNREAQERAMDIFHFALRPHGQLFLGTSESINEEKGLFTPLDKKHRLYLRRPAARAGLPVPIGTSTVVRALQARAKETPVVPGAAFSRGASVPFTTPPVTSAEERAALAELHFKLVERFAPPSVIVNDQQEVVHLSEHVGRFFQLAGGQLTTNLLRMVNPMLRADLRAALFRVNETGEPAEVFGVPVEMDGASKVVDLRVAPAGELAPGYLVVSFGVRDLDTLGLPGASPRLEVDAMVRHLEHEQEQLRHQLRDTVERYEASVEEYKASNEELQAMNEELRSASEELETSREELQSINEELTTVNGELKNKVDEVGQVNGDLQNFMSATDIATVFLDRGLRVMRYTAAATRVFSLIPSDTGRPLADLKFHVDYGDLLADARAVLRTLVPTEREVHKPGDGWFQARLLPYRTEDDHIAGVVLTLVDITARREAEESARVASARLRALTDNAPVLLWETSPAGATFLNQHYLDFFGRDFAALQGMGWADFLHPEDAQGYVSAYQRAFARGEPYQYECRFRQADGAYRWLLNVGRPFGENHFVGCSVDVTESKRAGEALRQNEQWARWQKEAFQAEVNGAPLGESLSRLARVFTDGSAGEVRSAFYLADAQGKRLHPVPGAGDMPETYLQRIDGFLIGTDSLACGLAVPTGDPVVTPDVLAEPLWQPWMALAEEYGFRGCWSFPITTRDNQGVGTFALYFREPRAARPDDLALAETITQGAAIILSRHKEAEERARAEEAARAALREAEQARGEAEAANGAKDHFLAVLSHELRTPLMPIQMALGVLNRRKDLPPAVLAAHDMIGRNVELETRFIDDMLDVTRIARGKMELVKGDTDLQEAIQRAVEVAAPDLEAKNQPLTVHLEAKQTRLHGDFARLQQVFWNLLKNASKFTPQSGAIFLRSRDEPGRVLVEVIDSGIGLEASAAERIFLPFEQADAEITREFGGLGLGLAIAKATVEAHGGELRATSPGPGRGATFTVSLPTGA